MKNYFEYEAKVWEDGDEETYYGVTYGDDFADGAMAILLLSWDWAVYLVTHPLWGGLTGFIIGFVLRMLLYHRKRRPSDHLTPEKRKLQKEYRRLLRQLRRRKLIGRDEVPTAAELLAIVEQHPALPPPRRVELTGYLKHYIVKRYAVDD